MKTLIITLLLLAPLFMLYMTYLRNRKSEKRKRKKAETFGVPKWSNPPPMPKKRPMRYSS